MSLEAERRVMDCRRVRASQPCRPGVFRCLGFYLLVASLIATHLHRYESLWLGREPDGRKRVSTPERSILSRMVSFQFDPRFISSLAHSFSSPISWWRTIDLKMSLISLLFLCWSLLLSRSPSSRQVFLASCLGGYKISQNCFPLSFPFPFWLSYCQLLCYCFVVVCFILSRTCNPPFWSLSRLDLSSVSYSKRAYFTVFFLVVTICFISGLGVHCLLSHFLRTSLVY